MKNYYVINLEKVTIEKEHPYTLVFKGYIPTYGTNRLYTFKYDGSISYTDATMPANVIEDFAKQLHQDYGSGILFDKKSAKQQLKSKSQYRMEM